MVSLGGKDYEDGKRRILIVGESHYIDEDIEDERKQREQEVKVDKYHTRNCLYEVLVDKSWCNRTYPNLMEALCDRGIISEDKLVLSKIAYYNFIQRQLLCVFLQAFHIFIKAAFFFAVNGV